MKRILASAALAAAIVPYAFGFEFASVSGKLGLTLFSSVGDLNTAPTPILGSFGASFEFILIDKTTFAFEPSIDFIAEYHLWYDGRAWPAEIERRESYTITSIIDLPLRYGFAIAENFGICASLGPAFVFRFPIRASGVDESVQPNIDLMWEYFWGSGRFLYISGGVRFDIGASETTLIGVSLRAFFPLFVLWSGDLFENTFIADFGIYVRFILAPESGSPSAPETDIPVPEAPGSEPPSGE